MKMLSVIIPVYNVERYIDKCISSIVEQDLQNFEIILVDDGSSDSSGKKCDNWYDKDGRIRVYHRENSGLMSAWKYGVMNASGKYIGFVDSDDWIEPNMFSTLLNNAENNGADIVACGLVKEFENGNPNKKEIFLLKNGVYDFNRIKEEIFPIIISSSKTPSRGLSPNRVTKLFRKDLLLSILPFCDDNVSIGEDLLTNFAAVTRANKLVVLSDFYPYHYRISQGSMINKYSKANLEKLKTLKKCLEKVNDSVEFNFQTQINNDYLSLTLQQLELEILFSNQDNCMIRQNMYTLYNDSLFQNALKYCDFSQIKKKHCGYLFLLKYKLYPLLIAIRKIKRVTQ